jgi:hypothetical protein
MQSIVGPDATSARNGSVAERREHAVQASGVVLLTEKRPDGVHVLIRRVRARDRVAARLHADRLDRQLARGVAPDADPQLALRARRLLRPAFRAQYASRLRRLVHFAQAHPPGAGDVMLTREQIHSAIPELLRLADRLEAVEPLDVRGIARTRLLLTDPAGPLFYRRRADGVSAAAEAALEALTPTAVSNT